MKKITLIAATILASMSMSIVNPIITIASDSKVDINFDATDILTKHESFIAYEGDDHNSYFTVFYTSSNKLKAILLEEHYYKSAGYTLENLSAVDMNDVFPTFTERSFTKAEFTDDGDYITCLMWFDDLDVKENFKQAAEMDIITLDDMENVDKYDYVDSTGIVDSFAELYEKVDLLDYETKNLHFAHLEDNK